MDFSALSNFLNTLPGHGVPWYHCTVRRGGETLFRQLQSPAEQECLTGEERFFIYSCTKLITCTAAMQLWEMGAFRLKDPVSRYLPEFGQLQVWEQGTAVPVRNSLTIQNLFTMTSGLSYELNRSAFDALRRETGGAMPTRQVIRALASEPLEFEPGSHWQYGLSHDVLGALIEVLTGQSLGAYIQQHILTPLGMTHTSFRWNAQELLPQAWVDPSDGIGKVGEKKNEYILGLGYESGGAGLVSTVNDYCRFLDMLSSGGTGPDGTRILGAETLALMTRNHLTPAEYRDFNGVYLKGYGYGLGMRVMVNPASGCSGSPAGEYGWNSAGGAFALVDPVNHIIMFHAQQVRNFDEQRLYAGLRDSLYQAFKAE